MSSKEQIAVIPFSPEQSAISFYVVTSTSPNPVFVTDADSRTNSCDCYHANLNDVV
jgi:hypothetical protein